MRGVGTEGTPTKTSENKRLRRSLVGVALRGHPIVQLFCKAASRRELNPCRAYFLSRTIMK